MAEVARRSGLGSATLYRNFATRQALLEALLVDEVDEVCAAAATIDGANAGERLANWLRRFFFYVTAKRPVVLGLLMFEDADRDNPVLHTRDRLLDAGRPLLSAARNESAVRPDLDLDRILDLVIAVAKIAGGPDYRQPILDAALAGLFPPA